MDKRGGHIHDTNSFNVKNGGGGGGADNGGALMVLYGTTAHFSDSNGRIKPPVERK